MPSQSKFSVLLVDDDATSNYLTTEVMAESDSFDPPVVFTHPQMALDYLKQTCWQTNQPLPQLLLIDINMPELNGFELVEKLKEMDGLLLEQTLLCILSSSSNSRDKTRAKTLGVACYYEKPLNAEHTQEMLTTLKSRL